MKYIRTKDNIVEHPHPNAKVFTFRYEVLKIADTIEELCDEFVVDLDVLHLTYRTDEWDLKQLGKAREDRQIYGAIWTDKGLIYVAKMNDKGELELL